MDYYKLFEKLCESKGVTLAEMCRDIGKPYSFVTELKMGRRKSLSQKSIDKVAEYFGVPVSTFFDEASSPVEQVQDELLVEKKLLFDISQKATKEQLDKIIEIAKIITKN